MNKAKHRISVALDTNSIREAIKQLRIAKKRVDSATNRFLDRSLRWIRDRAIENLKVSFPETEKDELKAELLDKATYEIKKVSDRSYLMRCKSEQGAYVEFGIGLIAQGSPHPKSAEEGYLYNLPSPAKRLIHGLPDAWVYDKQVMQGYSGTLFLYNAVMDFANSGTSKKIWADTLKLYFED